MKKVVYVSSYSNRTHHQVFNRLLLQGLLKKYEVFVFSTTSLLEQANCQKRVYKLYSLQRAGGISNLIRYLLGAVYDVLILLLSKKDYILVYNFNNPFSVGVLNWVNSFLKRKVFIFCHSEMELLINTGGGFLAKLLRFFIKRFFLKERKLHIYFCVLGDVIINNLKPIIKGGITNFISVEHPYDFYNEQEKELKKNITEVKLGTVGTLNAFKGLESYLSLIQKIKNPNIKFSVIGSIVEKELYFESLGVDVKGKGELLDRKVFESYIKELDYILFFYSKETYKLTASGAIFDAVKWEKPIIALKNDYFSYLFEKFGSIGFLCEDVEEMVLRIDEIREGNKKYNFDAYKTNLTIEKFATQLFIKLEDKLLCY